VVRTALAGAATLALLAPASSASADLPQARAQLVIHGDAGAGAPWHVELRVSSDRHRLRRLVVEDERCDQRDSAADVAVSHHGTRLGPFLPLAAAAPRVAGR
jgi:hypothetical protein